METVNGDFERDGPPPPSPLTGCYLLIVVGEPHSDEHRDIILQRIAKGLLSWNVNDCMVDLEKELELISEQALEGEEARHGERLIQFASENLVTEILIHPVVSTLVQCMRNLLSSFTRHRHIIHSGYTFAANGSWALQDGTFSYADFAEAFLEIETQRVIHAYENGISLDLHCSPEGDWCRLPKESFTKGCNARVNPIDVLTCGSPSITGFINYISQFLVPMSLENLLQCSDVVGNIRFSRPTLYVFPGGQGDAALFGVNGFNMLLDGGFSRKACFWDFVRHLDRLDAVLMTRLNNSNIGGISSILRRKRKDAVYPHLGHFFCNIQDRKTILSPDGDKDRDPLLIDLLNEGQEIVSNLHHLNLNPQVCYRDPEPINLYHKVGHGTLNMYVLNPAKDSKEVKEFIQRWNQCDQKLFSKQQTTKFSFPIQNLVSIAVLLIWQPANISDTITRILYPGSSPQQKIFEGLERLKNIEFVKHPVCSEKSLFSKFVAKKSAKNDTTDKVILKDKPAEKKEKIVVDNNINAFGGETKERNVKKSDSIESERARNKKIEENKIITENNEKLKMKTRKIKAKNDLQPRKKSVEKTDSPTTPKKSIVQEGPKKPITSTPAKSTKDANNRKVVENKAKSLKSAEPKAKLDKKPVSKKSKPLTKTPISPAKRVMNGLQKMDGISDRQKAKLEKDGTTDSSTVSTPTADQDSLKKDISNLTTEQIQQLKAQELADLAEEQEAVKEIEAVFRKGEARVNGDENMRKVKSISTDDDKSEKEEYLIIEKEDIDVLDEKEKKEIEIQKLTRDSEESEKQRNLIAEEDIQKQSTKEAKSIIKAKENESAISKDAVVTSQEEKVEIASSEKKSDKEAEVKDIVESHPDEKMSANIKSGDTTTAPTLPEDERIPLDEIKEDNGYPIEEKYVREETKEKGLPVIQLPTKTFDSVPKTPGVVGIRLDKQSHIRDIVKTPDEVADLPVHEEVDYEYAHESKTELKTNDATVEHAKSNDEEMRESKDEEKGICPAREIYEKADKEVMETKPAFEPKDHIEEKTLEIDVKLTEATGLDQGEDKEKQYKKEEKDIDDIVKTVTPTDKPTFETEQEKNAKMLTEQVGEDRKKLDEVLKEPIDELTVRQSTQENVDKVTTTESLPKEIIPTDKLMSDIKGSLDSKFEEDKKVGDTNVIETSTLTSEQTKLTKVDAEQYKEIEELHGIKVKSPVPDQIESKDAEEVCKSSEEEKSGDKSTTETSSVKSEKIELTKEHHQEIEGELHEIKDKSSMPQQIEKRDSEVKDASTFEKDTKDSEKSTAEILSVRYGIELIKEQPEEIEEKLRETKKKSLTSEETEMKDSTTKESSKLKDEKKDSEEKPSEIKESLKSEKIEKDTETKAISESEEKEKSGDKSSVEISSVKSGKVELAKEHVEQHEEIQEKAHGMEKSLISEELEEKDSKSKETFKSEEEKTDGKSSTEISSVKSAKIELTKKEDEGIKETPREMKEESLISEKMEKKDSETKDIFKSDDKEDDKSTAELSLIKSEKMEEHPEQHEEIKEKLHEMEESLVFEKMEKKDRKDSDKSGVEIAAVESDKTELIKGTEQYQQLEEKPHEIKEFAISAKTEKKDVKTDISKLEEEKASGEGATETSITKSEEIEFIKEEPKEYKERDEKLHEITEKSAPEQTGKKDSKPEEAYKSEKVEDKSIIETSSEETALGKQHTERIEEKSQEMKEKFSVSEQIKKEDVKIEEVVKFEEEKKPSETETAFISEEIELTKHIEQVEEIQAKPQEIKEISPSQQTKKEDEISKFEVEKGVDKSIVESSSLKSLQSDLIRDGMKEISSISEKIKTEDSQVENLSKIEQVSIDNGKSIIDTPPLKSAVSELVKEHTEQHEEIGEKTHEIRKKDEICKSEEEKKDSVKSSTETSLLKEEQIKLTKTHAEQCEDIEKKLHEMKAVSIVTEKIEEKDFKAKEISKSEEEQGSDKGIAKTSIIKSGEIELTKEHTQQYEEMKEKSPVILEKSFISQEVTTGDGKIEEISKSEEAQKDSDESSTEIEKNGLTKEHIEKQEEIKLTPSIPQQIEKEDFKVEKISKFEEKKDSDKSNAEISPIKSLTKEYYEEVEKKPHEMGEEVKTVSKSEEKSGDIKTTEISSVESGITELAKENTEQYEKIEDKPHDTKEEPLKYVKEDPKAKEVPESEEIDKSSGKSIVEISAVKPGEIELVREHTEQHEEKEEKPHDTHDVKEESFKSERMEMEDNKVKEVSKLEEKTIDKSFVESSPVTSGKTELAKEHAERYEEIKEKSHEMKEESLKSERMGKDDSKAKEVSKSAEIEKSSDKSKVEISAVKSGEIELAKEHTEQYAKIEEKPHEIKEESLKSESMEKEDSKAKEVSKLEEKSIDKSSVEISAVTSGKTELAKELVERYEEIEKEPHEMKEESLKSERMEKEDSKVKEVSKPEEKSIDKSSLDISAVISEKTELSKEHAEQHKKIEEKPHEMKEFERMGKVDFKAKEIPKLEEKEKSIDKSPVEISAVTSGKIELAKENVERYEETEDKPHEMKEESFKSEKMEKEDSKAEEVCKTEEKDKSSDKSAIEISSVKSENIELAKEHTEQYREIDEKSPELKEESSEVAKEDSTAKQVCKYEEKDKIIDKSIAEIEVTKEHIEKYEKTIEKPYKAKEEVEKVSDQSMVEALPVKSGDSEFSKEHKEKFEEIKEKPHEITQKSSLFEGTQPESEKKDSDSDKKPEQIELGKEHIQQREKVEEKLHEMKEESSPCEQIERKDCKMEEISKFEEEKEGSDKSSTETSSVKSEGIEFTKEAEKGKEIEQKTHEMKEEAFVSEQVRKGASEIEASKLENEGKPHERRTSICEEIKKDFDSKEIPKHDDDKVQREKVKPELLDKKPPTVEDLKTKEAEVYDDTNEDKSTDKMETIRKLPKDREEDVIKIVATVAEVLKSDAPLEEFKGKLPISFDTCKTTYVTELRETHITTTELPDETGILPIPEESTITDLCEEAEEAIKKSVQATDTTLRILSDDIKEALEEIYDSEEQGTVQRMLVTASSEDGGEEIEICQVGTIIFSKSSESSGRSSPEKSQESKKSSIVDTISDSLTTVKQYTDAELDADIGNVSSEQDFYLISDDKIKDKEEVTSLDDASFQKDEVQTQTKEEDKTEDASQKTVKDIQEEIKEAEQKETQFSKDTKPFHTTDETEAAHATDIPDICSKVVNGKDIPMEDIKIKPHSDKDILKSSIEDIKDSSKIQIKDSISESIADKTIASKSDFTEETAALEKLSELKSTVNDEVDEERKASTSDKSATVIGINGDTSLPELTTPPKDATVVEKLVTEDKQIVSTSDISETIALKDFPPEKSLDKKTEGHADVNGLIHEEEMTVSPSGIDEATAFKEIRPSTPPEKISGLITKTEVKADGAKSVDEGKQVSTSDKPHSEKVLELELVKKADHVDVDRSEHEITKIVSASDIPHKIDSKEDTVHPEKLSKMEVIHKIESHPTEKELGQKLGEPLIETSKVKQSEDEKKEDKSCNVIEITSSMLDSEKKESSNQIETVSDSSEQIKQPPLDEKQITVQKETGTEDLKHDRKTEEKKDSSESLLQRGSITPPTAPVSLGESESCSVDKKDETVKEKHESLVSETTKTDSTTLDTDTFFEDSVLKDKKVCKESDLMYESFYGTLPGGDSIESDDAELESSHLNETTSAKYVSHFSMSDTDKVGVTEDKKAEVEVSKSTDPSSTSKVQKGSTETRECWDNKLETQTSSLYLYELTKAKESLRGRVDDESEKKADTFALWGKPLGLPSPAPMTDNKGTPKKERKLPLNISVKNKWNDDKKRSESPSKTKNKKLSPIYVDLTYVPHHGNSYYSYVDFFKLVRARYYVFSGTEPGREVYNALLEAKQTWDDKELEVTIIPTYDTDVLGYWVAENEELLTKWKIDLSPSASRCTINLQDHETSCSAYRLEF